MKGGHDLGGMQGLGPVVPEANEPVFHAEWERRCFAVTLAIESIGLWNLDMSRFACENRHPAEYLTMEYYEIWLASLEPLLVANGLVENGELDGSTRSSTPPQIERILTAQDLDDLPEDSGSTSRPETSMPRFAVGDRVMVRPNDMTGHTRAPRYVQGFAGVVERVHGVFVFPDTNAAGQGECPQHLYNIAFSAQELWGSEARPGDQVYLDLWESYLRSTHP